MSNCESRLHVDTMLLQSDGSMTPMLALLQSQLLYVLTWNERVTSDYLRIDARFYFHIDGWYCSGLKGVMEETFSGYSVGNWVPELGKTI